MPIHGADMTQESLQLRSADAVDPEPGVHLNAVKSAEAAEEQARLILVEQVRLLYSNTAVAQVVTLLNGFVLAAVQSTALGSRTAVIWLAPLIVVAAVRIAMAVAYWKARLDVVNAVYWRNLFCFGFRGRAWVDLSFQHSLLRQIAGGMRHDSP